MLDFRPRTRSPNYLQGKQQFKLLGLMAVAGLIFVLSSMAKDADRWRWMFGGDGGNQSVARNSKPQTTDTRLATRIAESESPGTFVAAPEGLPSGAEEDVEPFFPGVRTDYLQTVRDDTVFRKVESDAWFHLFELLSNATDEDLAKATSNHVGFRQLYQQPKAYRGRVVTIEGTVRGALEKPALQNTYGIEKYYQLSIEPKGEPGEIVIAYALYLPKGFPLGTRIDESATVTGFFFKRWAYEASDAVRTAPLIVTKSIAWKPVAVETVAGPTASPMTALLIAFGLFLAVAIAFAVVRSRRPFPPSRTDETTRFSPETLAAIVDSDRGESGRPTLQDEA